MARTATLEEMRRRIAQIEGLEAARCLTPGDANRLKLQAMEEAEAPAPPLPETPARRHNRALLIDSRGFERLDESACGQVVTLALPRRDYRDNSFRTINFELESVLVRNGEAFNVYREVNSEERTLTIERSAALWKKEAAESKALASKRGDECGALASEKRELLVENAELRRTVERLERKAKR